MLTVAIIGLGSRGRVVYLKELLKQPERVKIVAVADSDEKKVEDAAKRLNLPRECCFNSGEELLKQPRLADAVLVCTHENQHVPQAVAAIRKGYHVLVEKPVAPDAESCRQLLAAAKEENRKVMVCYVLRYSYYYRKIKEILESGEIGEIQNIQAMENVRYWHFAHSFVRGNWRNSDITSPMFLAKCCHDMDILVWLTGQKCRRLSSFGGLSHFKAECAPEGAAMRCLDGCKLKGECPFDAEKIYITNKMSGVRYNTGWPNVLLTVHPTEETVREALEKGPYGRCVYHCDNNVVDHQVVNLEMESGLTITFSLCGLTDRTGRYMSIMGTKGYLVADMEKNRLEITRFGEKTRVVDFAETDDSLAGHGGGDKVLIQDFLDYLEGEMPKGVSTLEDSLESHFIAMAAEESRINGGMVVELDKYRFGGGW